MLRTLKIGTIAVLASVIGAPPAGAQSLTWGVFRENADNVSEASRNCWIQAMVSGQSINGEVMAQNLTEPKAELKLQEFAKRGLCAAERTAANWSARGSHGASAGDTDGSEGGSDWSNAGRFGR